MKRYKYVVCLDLEIGNNLEPEHISNINIISINLEDFNKRFDTDFIVNYSADDYSISPIDEQNHELLIWFLESVGELLAFAYSPTKNSQEDLDLYLDNRKKELNYARSKEMYSNFRTRYIGYAPLGFLEKPNYDLIKNKLTNLILDYHTSED